MRTKTTLGLMLICGAVLAACGQKEPAAPAASTAAAPAPVQTSTPRRNDGGRSSGTGECAG